MANGNAHTEQNIRKGGKVKLVEAGLEGLPKDHLHVAEHAAGDDLVEKTVEKAEDE